MLWGREADSPRGRIYLMKAAVDGRASREVLREHVDRCLGCMACVTACPSGVHYDRLIERVRPHLEAGGSRSLTDRAYRAALFALFPYPRRLRWIAAALRLAQRLGIRQAFRASGLGSHLPERLAALERIAPAIVPPPPEKLPVVIAAAGVTRQRVGLLLGCVQRIFFPDVNAATARVLAAEGCEVVVPREQGCCGALMLHAGRIEDARAAARRLIDVFDHAGVDQVVINAAGCGSAMKEYDDLLKPDAEYSGKARAFSSKCVDVSELLATLEPRAPRHPLRLRVAYQDACHLNHAQGIRKQPRRVLQTIPELEVAEIAEPDVCCGSAGVYNLLEPAAAAELRDRKVAHVRATGADVLVSANPGCLLQIGSGLASAGDRIDTLHIVQLLDASMRGINIRAQRTSLG
jgi:glycolate dehydrogenase iron-sulfur subunit